MSARSVRQAVGSALRAVAQRIDPPRPAVINIYGLPLDSDDSGWSAGARPGDRATSASR